MLSNNQQKKSIDAGHKFGHWTVLKKNRDETWLCKCRCGNKGDIPEAWLLSGFSRSCGCRRSRARDIRQRRFGRLTAIEPVAEKNTDGSIRWRCICDCGNETIVSSNHLLQNHTTSCGCLNKEEFTQGKTYVEGTCIEIFFSPKVKASNTSGHTGVSKRHHKWIAYITVGKKYYWLGSYDNYDEAVAARKKAEEEWKMKLSEHVEHDLLEVVDL